MPGVERRRDDVSGVARAAFARYRAARARRPDHLHVSNVGGDWGAVRHKQLDVTGVVGLPVQVEVTAPREDELLPVATLAVADQVLKVPLLRQVVTLVWGHISG